MRILHTGDWHLGDRLGSRGIDRTADLRRNIERIADYCIEHAVDVLLVAGDLFSDKMGLQRDLSDTVQHLGETFRRFLLGGGTILALTGNHDREVPCQTLRSTLALAAPQPLPDGALLPTGRLHLAIEPGFFRLADRAGTEVQFLLMPYPTPARYLDGSGQTVSTREERNRSLLNAYADRLQVLLNHPGYRPERPTVLSAHVHVRGASVNGLFRISEEQDVVFGDAHIPPGLAYVALGHIHQPQALGGLEHVRYCGSIERLDLGEGRDDKSVALVEIGPDGRRGEPCLLPLEASPIYRVTIDDPTEQLPRLREKYPDADRALVHYRLTWKAGEHDREAILHELDAIFPRWYEREICEASSLSTATDSRPSATRDPRQVVRDYLGAALKENDPDRDELLALAETLLERHGA